MSKKKKQAKTENNNVKKTNQKVTASEVKAEAKDVEVKTVEAEVKEEKVEDDILEVEVSVAEENNETEEVKAETKEAGKEKKASGKVMTQEEIMAKVKNDNTLKRRIIKNKTSYLMIAPYFILFFIFTILPVLISIILSFTYFNMLEFPTFTGWTNYIRLFLDDDIFLIALKNTLIFAVVTGPTSYFMCVLFAWIINEFKGKLRAFLTLVFYAPSICGQAYLIWGYILTGDRYGYLNSFLLKLGLLDEPVLWMKTEKWVLPILIVVQLWLSLGTGFLTFIAGLQTVDKSLYEAGAMDGIKNRWQELWYITLPSMKPQLMFGAVMQITQSFAVADISINLAGNPSVNYAGATIVTHLMDYGTTRFEMGYASAIATVLFLMMVLTNKLVQKILGRVGE